MELSRPDTQNKIISTAIEMIGRQINLNFTIREIAEKANVNQASVNYYFRSKENLINEVEQHFASATRQIYEDLYNTEIPPEDRIKKWALRLMNHLMEYPGILFLMVTKLISNCGMTNDSIVELLDSSEYSLKPIMKDITGVSDDKLVSLKVMQLMSGVVTPVLFHHGAGKTFGVDINDAGIQKEYIDILVKSII